MDTEHVYADVTFWNNVPRIATKMKQRAALNAESDEYDPHLKKVWIPRPRGRQLSIISDISEPESEGTGMEPVNRPNGFVQPTQALRREASPIPNSDGMRFNDRLRTNAEMQGSQLRKAVLQRSVSALQLLRHDRSSGSSPVVGDEYSASDVSKLSRQIRNPVLQRSASALHLPGRGLSMNHNVEADEYETPSGVFRKPEPSVVDQGGGSHDFVNIRRAHSEGDYLNGEYEYIIDELGARRKQSYEQQAGTSMQSALPYSNSGVNPTSMVTNDGENMVLHVVLPSMGVQSHSSSLPVSPNYSPVMNRHVSNVGSQQELITQSHYHQGLPHSFSSLELSKANISISKSTIDPLPMSDAEKSSLCRKYLSTTLSCIYAVFIVTVGVVIYISDILLGTAPLAEYFSLYLATMGFGCFLFLYIDIRKYLKSETQKMALNKETGNTGIKKENQEIHQYCFLQGRHSGSFYLKLGAAAFCLGHLIHLGLLLGYQIVFLTSDSEEFKNCASVPMLLLDIIYPVYSFFQLFFIFKYSNVIINTYVFLSRFVLMHCISSSICFWVWTILRETMDSLQSYENKAKKNSDTEDDISLEGQITARHRRGTQELLDYLNHTATECRSEGELSVIYQNFSPYLYPFTIEYSILIVGILFIIWQNIGKCGIVKGGHCNLPTNLESSNLVLHVDCKSANKGLFAGIIVLVGSIVSIILFFIAMTDSEYLEVGLLVNSLSELLMIILMTVSVVLAYRQLNRLDFNKHPISLLDDLLLFICIPAFFMYGILSLVPAVMKENYLSIFTILLQVLQVLIQTPFIIDGLRRCSNSKQLRQEKPGRELITFLVVCNVAMWIMETFEIKSQDKQDDRYEVYGKFLWIIFSHMTLPLTMFYRFHSSVCLADIWKSAYEYGE